MLNLITQRSVVQIHPPQPTPSTSCSLSVQAHPLTLRSHCQQLLNNLPVRGPFLLTHSLRVQVQSGADVRVS
jgi:hypothetical protein